jgi:histidinol-phosphate aminotransferase
LTQEKILIKYFGNIGNYEGALRATIGTREINDKMVAVFENLTERQQ